MKTEVSETYEDEMYFVEDLNMTVDRDSHKCAHIFVRVAPNRVECTKCHVGYFDSGDFPIEQLNEFFSDPKNQAYFKAL